MLICISRGGYFLEYSVIMSFSFIFDKFWGVFIKKMFFSLKVSFFCFFNCLYNYFLLVNVVKYMIKCKYLK